MRLTVLAGVVAGVLWTGGCAEEPQYIGAKPSIRTMRDQGGFRDTYVGADYRFALDRPSSALFTPAPEPIIHTPNGSPSDARQMQATGQ